MPDNESIRHVYILGAGASIPLGGPSFNQLLTNNPVVRRVLSSEEQSAEVKVVKNLHGSIHGLCECFGLDSRQPDVEQLLERLDYCENTSDSKLVGQVVGQLGLPGSSIVSNAIENVNKWIRIRLAIETSVFISQLPNDSERWDPYKSWFRSLSGSDTILTFNYDGVVEKSACLVDRPYIGKEGSLVESLVCPSAGMPALLKLHGSADWCYSQQVPTKIESVSIYPVDAFSPHENWETFISRGKHVLLGSPGLSKKRMSAELFKPLWDKARIALRDAHVISMVGYSMPATDNLAKQLILESIAANVHLKQINIVLGPDSNSPRAERVYELCKQVALSRDGATISNGTQFSEREKIVRLSSMYAQDFLPLHRPKSMRDIEISRLV